MNSFWNMVSSSQKSGYYSKEKEGCEYALSLSLTNGNHIINYTFKETIPSGYMNVCFGMFEVDVSEKRITRQTLHDKYNDCFTPDAHFILSMFFGDIYESNIPKVEVF